MKCPACHAENPGEAVRCSACGGPLKPKADRPYDASASQPGRRSGSRRRGNADEGENLNPAAWRAYRLALWSLLPGLGLFLGPAAVVLGCLALRHVSGDIGSRTRAKVAVLLGALVTLTQWLGLVLMIRGWGTW
jgi:hypothetical protein